MAEILKRFRDTLTGNTEYRIVKVNLIDQIGDLGLKLEQARLSGSKEQEQQLRNEGKELLDDYEWFGTMESKRYSKRTILDKWDARIKKRDELRKLIS